MRYTLKQIGVRPWTVSYLSVQLIESHYENNYGGALRRLNAITEQLESLDFDKTPGHVLSALKREQLIALNSTLLHELYFASLGGDGQATKAMSDVLARDFGSFDRWRSEFRSMGYALGGGSGWVLLTYVPRDGCLVNQYASEHSQAIAGGVPILALDMYEHAYHMDFGADAKAYVDVFLRNIDWPALERRYEEAAHAPKPRGVEQPEFGDIEGVGVEEVKAMMAAGKPVQVIDVRPRPRSRARTTSPRACSGAIPSRSSNGSASCRNPSPSSCTARTASTSAARPRSSCARPVSTRST